MFLNNPNTTAAPPVKVAINVGAMFDVITGRFLPGVRGEHVLNGGHSSVVGVVGIGNNFKSTLMHFFTLTAMARMSKKAYAETYDTEVNIQEWHLKNFYARIAEYAGEDLIETGRWKVTDRTVYAGNEWYKAHKDFLNNKRKQKGIDLDTPFWNRDKTGSLKMLIPTFSQIDSFTEFQTEDVEEINDKNELGDSGANTMHMRQGLSKLRLLMDAPGLNGGTYNYAIMTAHLGKETTMQNAGPGGQVPIVKLKHLKNGDKIKGTTDKFTFITHSCWHCYDARPLLNQATKTPLYPRDSSDDLALDTDLNELKVRNLRCKSGPSGMAMTLIVSQSEGILPSLTEFHHIKEMGNYGVEGSAVSYALSLLPDVKLGRTTIRGKIDENEELRRALNITSEMCQISYLWYDAKPVMCSPKELYDDLIAMGYDWKVLLATRGWWTTLENEEGLPPFLSTWDLLLMRLGEYVPFWFTAEQKAKIDLTKAKKRKFDA